MPSRCNYLFSVPLLEKHFFSSLTTCFGLAGHLQVCSLGKGTAVNKKPEAIAVKTRTAVNSSTFT
jgi:hypothetical protein